MGGLGKPPGFRYEGDIGAFLAGFPTIYLPMPLDPPTNSPSGTQAGAHLPAPSGRLHLLQSERGGDQRSRIQLDSSLRRWFGRNLGLWRSRRTYFFPDDEAVRVDMLLRVESFSEPVEGEAAYRFTWWAEKEYDFFDRHTR